MQSPILTAFTANFVRWGETTLLATTTETESSLVLAGVAEFSRNLPRSANWVGVI